MNLKISFSKLLIAILFLGLTQSSCKKDPIDSAGEYAKGVFIVNEGPFSNGTGTITHINQDSDVVIQDVFGLQNDGEPLGSIAQSMIKVGDAYYIAVNNAAKIVKVNAKTFVKTAEIKGIDLPRYFATDGNKLYVSAYGEGFSNGSVYEINTSNNTLSAPIAVGNSPETMTIVGNKLYVAIGSPFGANSKSVKVIDTNTNKVTNTIEVGDNPTAIVQDKNKNVWVLCSGDFVTPPIVSDGALYQIANEQVVKKYNLPNGLTRLAIDNNSDKLYFIGKEGVYSQRVGDLNYTNNIELIGSYYGLGFANNKNEILAAKALDFQSQGTITVLNLTSNSRAEYKSGIIPGFVYVVE